MKTSSKKTNNESQERVLGHKIGQELTADEIKAVSGAGFCQVNTESGGAGDCDVGTMIDGPQYQF